MIFLYGCLFLGIVTASSSVIMIKSSTENVILLAAWRLLVAGAILAPLYIRDLKKYRQLYNISQVRSTLVPGIALGLHFITWIAGARMTGSANATLIVCMVPAVMPFFTFFFFRELPNKNEIIGTVLALLGAIVLTLSDLNLSLESFWGDIMCFVSLLLLSFYLAMARKNTHIPTIWLYVVPLYLIAGVFCLLIALPFANPLQHYSTRELMYILELAIFPTIMGHSLINYCMQRMRGQVVSVAVTCQFITAGILAYLFLSEVPSYNFYPASVIVTAGVIIAIRKNPSRLDNLPET